MADVRLLAGAPDMTRQLRESLEQTVDFAVTGPPRAYFELFLDRDGREPSRGIYRTYAWQARDCASVTTYFNTEMTQALGNARRDGSGGTRRMCLVWRAHPEIEYDADSGAYHVRARLLVMDENLQQVELHFPDGTLLKEEGMPTPEIPHDRYIRR